MILNISEIYQSQLNQTPFRDNQLIVCTDSGNVYRDTGGVRSQLCGDIIEGYFTEGTFYEDSALTSELTGETGKLYIDLSGGKAYRWSGSAFLAVSASLDLGETSATAYRGDRGKTAYDHSQSSHAPSDAERNQIIGIQRNGSDMTVSPERKVNISVPTKVSELANDAGYKSSDHDTTYELTKSGSTILLTGSDGSTTSVTDNDTKTTTDSSLSFSSVNPVQNQVITSALAGKVPNTRSINGKSLSSDITLAASDVGADPSGSASRALTDAKSYSDTALAGLKGTANGLAELDAKGKVPAGQLPSYVDDVLEGYYSGGKFYEEAAHTAEISGESGKIYIDLNTNKTYRWSGSSFAVVSETLALGETSSTAYRGDRGKTAFDHSQSAHAPADAEKNILTGIQKNGADLPLNANRRANITVPTKVSELTNDSGYKTTDSNTTYTLSKTGNTIFLTGSDGSSAAVTDSDTKITIDSSLSATSVNPVQNKIIHSALEDCNAYSDNRISALKGAPNGLAELGSDGKLPAAQLPSDVNDVWEGYLSGGNFYADSSLTLRMSGESGKLYIDLSSDKIYRWSGSAFTIVSDTLSLGETASSAYRGDRGKAAYDHSQTAHAPSGAEPNIITGIQKNGSDIPVTGDRKINITVPVKVSQLTNDAGYITSDHNTTYTLSKTGSTITLTGSDGSVTTVADSDTKITIDSALSAASLNPVQNKIIYSELSSKVPASRAINGKSLSSDLSLSASDIGADPAGSANRALTDAKSYSDAKLSALKGSANGLAELDQNGLIPSSQLPSYVDDVIEGYLSGGIFYAEAAHTTKITGESGKIYIDLHTSKTYRWSGTAFSVISETLALGETSSTAYRGDRGKAAYDHSQTVHAPSNAERNTIIGIQKNGADLSAGSDRKINITVPTKVSDLSNDKGYKTTDSNTTYTLSKSGGTIILSGSDGSAASVSDSDTIYAPATTLEAGLMSASDKKKLNNVADGANAYVLPVAGPSTLGGVKTSSAVTSAEGYSACPIINGIPYFKSTDITYTLESFGITATADELNVMDGITATVNELNYCTGVTGNIQSQINGKADKNHSHSYLPLSGGTITGELKVNGNITGSLSGNASSATTAAKLSTSAGSVTQPVYFNNGKPVATGYSLAKSVPSDAKFTDTVYTHPATAGSKHIPAGGSGRQLLGYGGTSGTAMWMDASSFCMLAGYGVTTDTANPLLKDVTIEGLADLKPGTMIAVRFSSKCYAETAINVNGFGYMNIVHDSDFIYDNVVDPDFVCLLVYEEIFTGGEWQLITNQKDTKVTSILNNTTKAYITGTITESTNTGTQIFDNGVYLDTTAGRLHAGSVSIGPAVLQYNSEENALQISFS